MFVDRLSLARRVPGARLVPALACAIAILGGGGSPRAQVTPAVNPDDILYILPTIAASTASLAAEYQDLLARLGDGRYVKVGFSRYIDVSLTNWNVDVTDRAAIRASLAGTIQQIDAEIDAARAAGYPLALNVLTAIRGLYDPAQRASQDEDRRNMMWYSDNSLAAGWWTHSRYARKQRRIQEAHIRELGRVLADRMARYPETLIAASGDGEIELAHLAHADPARTVYSDYSPFAVAEFRDWIRAGGRYAAGQPFAGQSYEHAARYAGDSSPALDTNGDGHTLNADFATAFTTWDLRSFDWQLADTETLRAISSFTPFNPASVSNAGGFDAPRVRGVKPSDYFFPETPVDYWKLWLMFRVALVHRHNIDFAKWITTSASVDAATAGALVPGTRWSSYQIPADYLFNGSPSNPNDRFESSASSWTTADVSPYATAGFTSFNVNFNCDPTKPLGPGGPQHGCGGSFPYFLTFHGLAPAIASRNLRFSLVEWHPAASSAVGLMPTENPFLFSNELALLKKYRPTMLAPFIWNDTSGVFPIKDTGMETMLRQLVSDLKDGLKPDARLTLDGVSSGRRLTQPFTLTGTAYDLGKVRGSGRDTGIDAVTVRAIPALAGSAITLSGTTYGEPRPDVASVSGAQFGPSGLRQVVSGLPPGTYDFIVSGHSTVTGLTSNGPPTRITILTPTLTVDRSSLRFAGVRSGLSGFTSLTALQEVLVTATGPGSSWTATASQPWVTLSPSSGTGTKSVLVGINPLTAPSGGNTTATITFAASDALADPVTVAVSVVVTAPSATPSPPLGSFDTPTEGSSVSGSIAVTGWALDDVDVARIELWRDAHPTDPVKARFTGTDARAGKVFIGNAAFVEGARPDIEGLLPNTPRNYRAGWGYIMLTRGLPWDREGPFKLHAFAIDAEGNLAALGAKTITVDNAVSLKPFGAIDTPGQGETVSGIINNFGWVLAGGGGTISQQNVQVFIDNVFVGNPGGLSRRSDLDAAFGPLGFDTSQANRVLQIDTTKFANGVHTIGWLVTDSNGRTDGVGSRFIRILNTTTSSLRATVVQ